jgi:DivIVA domain-containing protein
VAAHPEEPSVPAEPSETEPIKPDFTAEELREHVPAEIRTPSFPNSVRGYDRTAVDAYLKRVNRVIAELEVSRSPQAAVRHALDRVGQQTIAVLQEARESADKLMAAARQEGEEARARAKEEAAKLVVNASAEADRTKAESEQLLAATREQASDILARARAEAAEKLEATEREIAALREQAEARMQEIDSDTQIVLHHRRQLLEDVEEMAGQLQELARAAATRVAEEPAAETTDERADDAEMVTLAEGNQQPPKAPGGPA